MSKHHRTKSPTRSLTGPKLIASCQTQKRNEGGVSLAAPSRGGGLHRINTIATTPLRLLAQPRKRERERGTGPPRTRLHKAVVEDDAAYGSLSDSHVKEQKTPDASQRHRSGSASSKMSGIAGANPSRAVHLHSGDM